MKRRDFIRIGAGCAAAAAAGLPGLRAQGETAAGDNGEAAEPESGEKKMKLGLVTYNMAAGWDLTTIIQRCRNTGYEGVELRTTHAHGVEPDISGQRRSEVRQMFADAGLTLWGLGTACEYHQTSQDEVRRNIELTKKFCELARDVGATGVKVRPNGLPEGVPEDQTLKQIGLALRECGAAAKDNGVEIWLEVHGPQTQEPVRIRKIMHYCGHPSVGVCWNSNPTDVKEGSVRQSLELLRPFLLSCHITELANDYPWAELFGLLKSSGYNRFTLQEIQALKSDNPDDIERFMRYYRKLWLALQGRSA